MPELQELLPAACLPGLKPDLLDFAGVQVLFGLQRHTWKRVF